MLAVRVELLPSAYRSNAAKRGIETVWPPQAFRTEHEAPFAAMQYGKYERPNRRLSVTMPANASALFGQFHNTNYIIERQP